MRTLRDPRTIRERCANIARAVRAGESEWFELRLDQLDQAAALVEAVTREGYPELRIPYHSRWRHFEAGGIDRGVELNDLLRSVDPAEQARARIDLTVVSVLLDAGAGPRWRYQEPLPSGPPQSFARSEGLGVATFRGFLEGAFSSSRERPLRVDAAALIELNTNDLARLLQVHEDNPIVGLQGRAELMCRLGNTLHRSPELFGAEARPGGLYDVLRTQPNSTAIDAAQVLQLVLDGLSPIWLTGSELEGEPLGDVWRHPRAGGSGASTGWVPFHKLSQWLTYSLLEPLEWAGHRIIGQDALTALPEYRNGGLLLDTGVIRFRDPAHQQCRWHPSDECIVEWRALTVSLIDALAKRLRTRLGLSAERLPLARVLEGGTWAAGRAIAARLRDGAPPLDIESDGSIF